MLRGQCSAVIRTCARRSSIQLAKFSSSSSYASQGPNAPLDLDPSLQELLRDADMALLIHKPRENMKFGSSSAKELEVLELDESWTRELAADEDELTVPRERKSVRASFGSTDIGSVFIPNELKTAIEKIIDEGDKPRLHEDAKRLFSEQDSDEDIVWNTVYEAEYRSWKQAKRHAERDSTAFASIALPAHYSAIYAVLDHAKHRLGDEWSIRSVIDWGSGVGSGLWASMHLFNKTHKTSSGPDSEVLMSQSQVYSYLGIEKRETLSSMAKKLLEGSDLGTTDVRWRRGYSDSEQASRSENNGELLALSAFHLSSLPNPIARKGLIKQMWSSGADVIVLIDHDTSTGFRCIAEAREQLLHLGRKESEKSTSEDDAASTCHVVAPCPHDGACPLFKFGKSKLNCTFSQRLQRPAFLRKTKHVRAGHEDIGYSYVVIRRGKRPSSHRFGNAENTSSRNVDEDPGSTHNIRLEAYDWPRMVFPPLKRSGHVIIDACTSEGKIMRMTIPRSQGKQPYYDARKSSWGDIFPHKPKNPPQIRVETKRGADNAFPPPGSDIGKRRLREKNQDPTSYSKIFSDIEQANKSRKRDWVKAINALKEE